MTSDPRKVAKSAKRIIVKVGSSTLAADGKIRPAAFASIVRQVSELMDDGREVVIVSSGAIAVGSLRLGWERPGHSIPEKQAAAAVGQAGLVEHYGRRFARRGRQVAQVLLTRSGLEHRERFLNARRTFQQLLKLGVVPIVNENDTVATDEIRFGDNDNLSATLVNVVGADLLIILTDVEGLLERQPTAQDPKPKLIPLVERITKDIERIATGAGSTFGSGGMLTKLQAAKTAGSSGAATLLIRGSQKDSLLRAARGDDIGTLFLAENGERRMASRKHWLAYTARTRGELVLDAGAVKALVERGRSLLPAGILAVRGRFQIGDAVSCLDEAGRELARGLAAYPSDAVEALKGCGTAEIERVLGYTNGSEVIHRDDLVVLDSGTA